MAISINWLTKRISVPKADLTFISGTLYEHDTDAFRLELRALEDDEEGMPYVRTHRHVTEITIVGVTYARFVEIINGYSVEYEDGAYSVQLTGSNNNIWDIQSGILVQNQVQVIPTNSAGLINTPKIDSVYTELTNIEGTLSHSDMMKAFMAALCNKSSGADWGSSGTMTFRDYLDTKNRLIVNYDPEGNRLSVTIDVVDEVEG